MSSSSVGAAPCASCGKFFKRLSTHIALSPACEKLYMTTGNVDINIASRRSERIIRSSHHDSSVVYQDDGISVARTKTTKDFTINHKETISTRLTIGDKSDVVKDHIDVMPRDDEDNFQLFDDTLPCNG